MPGADPGVVKTIALGRRDAEHASTVCTGPKGERLRRTALASSLGPVWTSACLSTCGGARV